MKESATQTLLNHIVYSRYPEAMACLETMDKIDFDCKDELYKRTILHLLASRSLDEAKELWVIIKQKYSPDEWKEIVLKANQESPLLKGNTHLDISTELLAIPGITPHEDEHGRNLLMQAIDCKNFELAQFLIGNMSNDDLNYKDKSGKTVLHYLVNQPYELATDIWNSISQRFIDEEWKAMVLKTDKETPLITFQDEKGQMNDDINAQIAEKLLEIPEFSTNRQESCDGRNILMEAIIKQHYGFAKLCLEKGNIDIDHQDNAGNNALHIIGLTPYYISPNPQRTEQSLMVVKLIRKEIDFSHLNKQGKRPVDLLHDYIKNYQIKSHLCKEGETVSIKDYLSRVEAIKQIMRDKPLSNISLLNKDTRRLIAQILSSGKGNIG